MKYAIRGDVKLGAFKIFDTFLRSVRKQLSLNLSISCPSVLQLMIRNAIDKSSSIPSPYASHGHFLVYLADAATGVSIYIYIVDNKYNIVGLEFIFHLTRDLITIITHSPTGWHRRHCPFTNNMGRCITIVY